MCDREVCGTAPPIQHLSRNDTSVNRYVALRNVRKAPVRNSEVGKTLLCVPVFLSFWAARPACELRSDHHSDLHSNVVYHHHHHHHHHHQRFRPRYPLAVAGETQSAAVANNIERAVPVREQAQKEATMPSQAHAVCRPHSGDERGSATTRGSKPSQPSSMLNSVTSTGFGQRWRNWTARGQPLLATVARVKRGPSQRSKLLKAFSEPVAPREVGALRTPTRGKQQKVRGPWPEPAARKGTIPGHNLEDILHNLAMIEVLAEVQAPLREAGLVRTVLWILCSGRS